MFDALNGSRSYGLLTKYCPDGVALGENVGGGKVGSLLTEG
jgi:hypothetical protein